MKFEDGARVEVTGDPDDPGFAGSWWTAVVVRHQRRGRGAGQVTVRYDELLEDDGVTRAEETVPAARVRPACADDSCTKPLAERLPGDPVDCWHDDGFWEGYVHRVFDDHITVFFPASNEEYTDIYAPSKPLDPAAHRVRTGRDWDGEQGRWTARPRKLFDGSGNFCSQVTAANAAALPAQPKATAPKAAKALGRNASSYRSSSSSEEDVPLIARKAAAAAAAAAERTGQRGRKAPTGLSSKGAQSASKLAAAPAPAAADVAAQPAARHPAVHAAADVHGTSSEGELLLFHRGQVTQAAAQQQQQQQQPAAQLPTAPALKEDWAPRATPSAAASKAANAAVHKASEFPESGLAAANASVADLLTSLDAGDEADETRQRGSKASATAGELPAPAGLQAQAPALHPAAPPAADAPMARAKQAAPAAAVARTQFRVTPPAVAAPTAAKPQATAAAAATKPAAVAPRQQSAPKQPLQRQLSAPAQPAPVQLPTSLGDLKAPPPKRQQQPHAESPQLRQQSGLQLPTSLADLKAPPPKRQRQDVLPAEPPLHKQLSDAQQRKQEQQPRADQRQQDVRQPPAMQSQQQQQQHLAAAAGRGKAAAAAKQMQRTGTKGAGRSASSKFDVSRAAAATSGEAQRLAPLIPKRAAGGESSTRKAPPALASTQQAPPQQPQQQPLLPPPPPPQQQQQCVDGSSGGKAAARKRLREENEAHGAAAAAARVPPEAKQDCKRGRSGGAAPTPPAEAGPAAAAAVDRHIQQQQAVDQYDPNFPTVWCLDNLPASISSAVLRQALGGIGVAGVKSVDVAAVPLDVGDRHGGYAVLRFASAADAQREYDKLHSLCIRTLTCPIPRPLIIRRPRIREGYAWGPEARLPGHFPLDFRANQHFVQPNSIEFDMAIEWRQALGQLAAVKQELCMEQAMELAELMARYLQAVGEPHPPIVPARLQLPGEVAGPGSSVAAGEGGACSPSSCVWLSGVLASASEEQLVEAFAQFGCPQKARLVQDPVTGKPSSHAVLWMESNQRALDLVQNLREMVYLLNGTPRAVDASLAVPGPARGSQSTYDRALRCMFGADDSQLAGSVQFVVVRDDELLELPSDEQQLEKLSAAERAEAEARRAAIALRRLLRSHRKEQDELAAEKRERLRALDVRQRQHFADEKLKLGRLAVIQYQQIGPSQFLIDHLLERHGIQGVRVYRNNESCRLMRYAEELQREKQRAAAEQARAAQRAAVHPRR